MTGKHEQSEYTPDYSAAEKLLWVELDDISGTKSSLERFLRTNPNLFRATQELASDIFGGDMVAKRKAMGFLAKVLAAIDYTSREDGDDGSEQPLGEPTDGQ